MAATSYAPSSSPAIHSLPSSAPKCLPLLHANRSFISYNHVSCFSGSKSSICLSRLRLFPSSASGRKWRHGRPAVCAVQNGDRDGLESGESDVDKGATIDLKLPRRRLLVQFTCNECGERTNRLVNPLAYERGLVYVQCAGCLRHHKLVDNLGLVVEYDLREENNVKSDTDQHE